ncbi:zinc-ribbon domain-containing protein [Wolbachia pipientis]|uniref:zinc-ribbon domain-containing protein n=1 Tax=Wolbachia pipientis TaxID=955 RepID=UPI0025A36425|nr:zinc-ribbon domain-containing protein [Wolbachia pipientis]MDM8335179.1 zinc-ribbon domain-containing protein [Wolbachia pipientis]
MRIKCNNCTKTYLVPYEQIGEFVKKVRCTNCNHTWYLSGKVHTASIREKKVGGRNFLVFATLAFAVITGLCIVVSNPREMNKVYRTISSYKDSISCKLGYKKEQIGSSNVKKLAASKFYQDYLFLSNLRSS